MKKFFSVCMVAIALLMAVPTQAQLVKFGIKGGMNFSKLDFSAKELSALGDQSTGFFVGPMAEINLPISGIGIDGALLFSQRGKDAFKKQGIEIPVNLKYTFGLGSVFGIYFAAGPNFYFVFDQIDHKEMKAKKTNVALNLGTGLKLLKKIQLGVVYQVPMKNSFDVKSLKNEVIGESKTWQLSMAYMF